MEEYLRFLQIQDNATQTVNCEALFTFWAKFGLLQFWIFKWLGGIVCVFVLSQ